MSVNNPVNIQPYLAQQLSEIQTALDALNNQVQQNTDTETTQAETLIIDQIMAARDFIVANIASDTVGGQGTLVDIITDLVNAARDAGIAANESDNDASVAETINAVVDQVSAANVIQSQVAQSEINSETAAQIASAITQIIINNDVAAAAINDNVNDKTTDVKTSLIGEIVNTRGDIAADSQAQLSGFASSIGQNTQLRIDALASAISALINASGADVKTHVTTQKNAGVATTAQNIAQLAQGINSHTSARTLAEANAVISQLGAALTSSVASIDTNTASRVNSARDNIKSAVAADIAAAVTQILSQAVNAPVMTVLNSIDGYLVDAGLNGITSGYTTMLNYTGKGKVDRVNLTSQFGGEFDDAQIRMIVDGVTVVDSPRIGDVRNQFSASNYSTFLPANFNSSILIQVKNPTNTAFNVNVTGQLYE